MERTAYSVSAENCPGSKQDSLINSGNSCSCIFRQGGLDDVVSSILEAHPEKLQGEGSGERHLLKMGSSLNAFQHTNPNIEGPQWAWLAPWRAEVSPGKAAWSGER